MRKRNDNFEFETSLEFLTKNELLLPDSRITNGCFLMFSEGENLYTTIQMGHFQDEITIKDNIANFDDILTLVDEVMSFIRKHIYILAFIPPLKPDRLRCFTPIIQNTEINSII